MGPRTPSRNRTLAPLALGGLALALVLTLAPHPAQGPRALASAGATVPAVVPFEMLASNHMVVRARVNGKGPYRFIFDLGAPTTLLSNRAAEESGVLRRGAPRSFLFGMRGEAEIKTLGLGTLDARDLPVMVLDHPALKALGGLFTRPPDGILGFTFFARYRTTIDYQKREMTFVPVDFRVSNVLKDLPERIVGPKLSRRKVLAPGGLLGVTVAEAEPGAAGVRLTGVSPGSPAEAAGLKAGDLLTTLDGRWTASVADTYAAAAGLTPGKPAEVVVARGGAETTLTVTPADGL